MNLVNLYCCFIVFFGISQAQNVNIAKTIVDYFNQSDIVRSFRELWKKQKSGYENAFLPMLRQSYGRPEMNVFVRKMFDTHKVADAFYVSDNILDVLMKDLRLAHLPILTAPEVDIDLDSNVARFRGVLGKVIVHATYVLFRNYTAVVFSGSDLNLQKTSPFSLQQVQSTGQLSITADWCRLSGLVITKLSGARVDLGHDSVIIDNCDLNVEIWSPGLGGSPPIIAPYFSKEQGIQLERLLSKPMRDELMPKLQAAMYSYINTDTIFGKDLSKFRAHHYRLLRDTSAYLRNVVMDYNKLAVARGQDTLTLANERIAWTERIQFRSQSFEITISNVRLHGLDTACLSHSGGPYKHKGIKIEDGLLFKNLQVRGQINVKSRNTTELRNFGAELHDVEVNLVIDVGASQLSLQQLEVVGWRSMELNHDEIDSVSSRSLLTGYLINEIPKATNKQVRVVFAEALTGKKNSQADPYEKLKSIESSKEINNDNIDDDDNNVKQSYSDNDSDILLQKSEDENDSNNRGDAVSQNVDEDVLKMKVKIHEDYSKKDDNSNINDSTVNSAGDENDNENSEYVLSDDVPNTDYETGSASQNNVGDDVIKLNINIKNDNLQNDDNCDTNNSEINSAQDKNCNENSEHENDDASHQNVNKDINVKDNISKDNLGNDDNSNINNSEVDSAEDENDLGNDDNSNINNSEVDSAEDENSNENRNSEHEIDDASHQNVNEEIIKLKVNIVKDNLENDDNSNTTVSASNSAEDDQRENRGADLKSGDVSQQNLDEEVIKVKVNLKKDVSQNDDNSNMSDSAVAESAGDNSKGESRISGADKRKYNKKNIQRKHNVPSEDIGNKYIKQKSIYPFRGLPMFDNEIHSE